MPALANFVHPARTASHGASNGWPPALVRAAGLAGWTLVIGCFVWRGPFRFVLGTVGAGLLMHGAWRRESTALPGESGRSMSDRLHGAANG